VSEAWKAAVVAKGFVEVDEYAMERAHVAARVRLDYESKPKEREVRLIGSKPVWAIPFA
jgi:hypothetical protein